MRKVLFLLCVISVLIGCRKAPGNEPKKIVADIALPITLEPFEVHDEWLSNGDGLLIHRYHLDATLYEDIEKQLNKAKASKLPFAVNLDVDNKIFDFIDDNDQGLYLITYDPEDDGGSTLVVLNYSKMELTVLMSYI